MCWERYVEAESSIPSKTRRPLVHTRRDDLPPASDPETQPAQPAIEPTEVVTVAV